MILILTIEVILYIYAIYFCLISNQEFSTAASKNHLDIWCWIPDCQGYYLAKEPTPVVMFDTSPNTHHH